MNPRIILSSDAPVSIAADVLVIGALQTADGAVLHASEKVPGVPTDLTPYGFAGKADELLRVPATDGKAPTIAVIGLGAAAGIDELRAAAGSAVRQLAGAKSVVFALPLDGEAELLAVIEGATLGAYSFPDYRGKTKPKARPPVETVTIATSLAVADEALERIAIVGDSVRLVKNLMNTPGAELSPEAFGQAAKDAAKDLGVGVEIWDEKKLAIERCGGIIGVGQGSSRQPRLVKVSYEPAKATKHIAFVGKGITFDTGGYALKPWDAMRTMHHDMGGAAVILGVVLAAARLELPVKLTAWLCVAENMVSSTAIRPNDILTMRDGTTVEVINTDAEGRLVMADGLSLASEQFPDAIIDIATLTGAAIVSLGRRTAGVMGDPTLVELVAAAGASTGEAHWPMPLPPELRALLDSKFADLANINAAVRDGGMLVAGLFLQEFVGTQRDSSEKIPWVHLDIAGTGTNNGPGYGSTGDGGTGASVRTVLTVVEQLAAS
ncbi:leucyl aminopeptidase [soil metagenome]